MKKNLLFFKSFAALLLILALLGGCKKPYNADGEHGKTATELIKIVNGNKKLGKLFEKSIRLAAKVNPDLATNPAQNWEDYLKYLDAAEKCLPWGIVETPSVFWQIDQTVDYFYFLLDQPLDEMKNKGYYRPTLQYHPAIQEWIRKYCTNWGDFLKTTESWNDDYYEMLKSIPNDPFGLDKKKKPGTEKEYWYWYWYEEPKNWTTFNEFFQRRLRDPSRRPIDFPEDESIVVSPADAVCRGIWKIDEDSRITMNGKVGVTPKSNKFNRVDEILHGSKYAKEFAGGTLTHCFLNVNDYHRYHFPVAGTILEKETRKSALGDEYLAGPFAGGDTIWIPGENKYVLNCDEPSWQSIETRHWVIIQTNKYGLVAVIPIGMSQVNSVNFEEGVEVNKKVNKGDGLGYFLFGGSDIIMIFQKDIEVELLMGYGEREYNHTLMGEKYAKLSKKH